MRGAAAGVRRLLRALNLSPRATLARHSASLSLAGAASAYADTLDEFTARLLRARLARHESAARAAPALAPAPTQLPANDECLISAALARNDHKQIEKLLSEYSCKDNISEDLLTTLFVTYSSAGRPDRVANVQDYCRRLVPMYYTRNGELSHYLAKAHCMRGNSEKGLSLLSDAYEKNRNLRNVYRVTLQELIQDSVSNRSEATMVIFRKYVSSFSERWNDHYPMVCFWHACWASTWFSDQRLADELLESQKSLREIIRDRATTLTSTVLRHQEDDDAVVRLLQALLRYDMMLQYVKVLQILFHFRLKNRDMRGCAEIIRNCDTLGLNMSSDLQGKYIRMIINGENVAQMTESPKTKPRAKPVQDFKLKF